MRMTRIRKLAVTLYHQLQRRCDRLVDGNSCRIGSDDYCNPLR
jgi:hypothetical protein